MNFQKTTKTRTQKPVANIILVHKESNYRIFTIKNTLRWNCYF